MAAALVVFRAGGRPAVQWKGTEVTPRLLRRAGLLALALTLLVLPGAAGAATSGATSGNAMVRVTHFSPDAPAVDVYVNGNKTLSGVTYKTVSKYLSVPPGSYRFEVRPAGAAPSSKAVIDASRPLQAGQAATVAAIVALANIQGRVYIDDLSAPTSSKAKVRVIHAASEVPAVDVAVAGGPTLFSGVSYPNATQYAEVAVGSYSLQVRPAGGMVKTCGSVCQAAC